MTSYEFEKYVCTPATMKTTIETYGVAIIPSILNDMECNEMIDGIWEFIHHITQHWPTPILRENRETYKEIHKLHLLRGAMFQQFSNGHAQYLWNLRQNPKILEVFSHFWGVSPEELLVSFDGTNFSIPNNQPTSSSNHHKARKGGKKSKEGSVEDEEEPWYHLDQSLTRPDFECIQSWVTAFETGEGDATLAILENSHRYFAEFAASTASKSMSDWKMLNKDELEFYQSRGCEAKRIKCPKGSLVLWDSRTVHYGAPSLKRPTEQNFRLVGYICYRPRYFISKEMLKLKRESFNKLDTTSHHPTNFRVFRKLPAYVTLEHPVTSIDPPVLNALGMRLAGFEV